MEGVTRVYLYPETDEPVPILNIKRGILSALIVPVMEDEQNISMVGIFSQPRLPYFKIEYKRHKDVASDVNCIIPLG